MYVPITAGEYSVPCSSETTMSTVLNEFNIYFLNIILISFNRIHVSLGFPSGIFTSYYRSKVSYTLLPYLCVLNAHLSHRILFGHR